MNILLLREAMLLAIKYDVHTPSQFETFIAIAQADGITPNELAGCTLTSDSDRWRRKASTTKRLLIQDAKGECLIYRAEKEESGGRPAHKLRLTSKGFRLLEELRDIGFQ